MTRRKPVRVLFRARLGEDQWRGSLEISLCEYLANLADAGVSHVQQFPASSCYSECPERGMVSVLMAPLIALLYHEGLRA